jgi:hypothetical protein
MSDRRRRRQTLHAGAARFSQPVKQKCYVDDEQYTSCRGQKPVEPLAPGDGNRNRAKGEFECDVGSTGQVPEKRGGLQYAEYNARKSGAKEPASVREKVLPKVN